MLIDKMKLDRIVALKSRDHAKKNLLGVLISDATKQSKQPADAAVISIVKKFVKNAEENLERMSSMYSDVLDTSSYERSMSREIVILSDYLPKQLTEYELEAVIISALIKMEPKLGNIMKHMKDNYEGRYDGKQVSEVAKNLIAKIIAG